MWIRKLVDTIAIASIIALSSYFMLDLQIPGLPKLHDSNPHIARMINYHSAIQDGQFPPMWGKELLGGIGSPVMMLNYQLPYMITEIFVQAGLGIFDSYKLALALSFILSGALMYLALKSRHSTLASYLGAMIYTLAPYRMVDIYVRGALGESLSFIFPPLLIWGLVRRSWPLLILGWAGLFLTHPVASATFSAFFLGYVLIVLKRDSLLTQLKLFFGPYLIALAIAAFNLVPTLSLTPYTYYSPMLSDTLLMFPTLSQLFDSPWGYGVSLPGTGDGMSFELGDMQWIVLLLAMMLAIKAKRLELRYLVVTSLITLYFILPISIPFYQNFSLTSIIDFPWRLILCLLFAVSWMAAIVLEQITHRHLKKFVMTLVVGLLVFQVLPMSHTGEYWDRETSWFARETGDSYGEYAPRTRATKDSSPYGERAEFVQGQGSIETMIDKSNWQKYRVESKDGGSVRINTAYFPGWEMPDNCQVTIRSLSHIDDSGLMLCTVPPGQSIIDIKYVAPAVQSVGNLITLGGIGAYLWILFRSYYPRLTKEMR